MVNDEGTGAGACISPRLVACGAGIVAWVLLVRRVRALELRVNEVARKAELARRNADHVLRALAAKQADSAAGADVTDLQCARDAVREMIGRAEAAQRAYGPHAPPQE